MGDVLQYLIDGTSGIVTGGVDGKALVAGVCSRGIVGKAYLIGKRTDLAAMLGTGPLVDRVRDMLTTGGQAPYVVAVPVQGQPGGYISGLSVNGGKAGATLSGYPALNVMRRVKLVASTLPVNGWVWACPPPALPVFAVVVFCQNMGEPLAYPQSRLALRKV